MAFLLLLLLCVITSQAAPSRDNTVLNLTVETTTSAANQIDNDVSRYPSVADYDNLNYFRSRISVLSDGTLLAGAINKLYHIGHNFTEINRLNWEATETAVCDFTYDSSPFHCGNHIRIHELQQDGSTLLVCGTNAILPRCRLHNLANLALIPNSTMIPQPGLVPFLPDFKGLTIKNDAFPGGVLAVNYLGNLKVNFGISYQFLNITDDEIDNTIQYRSIQGNVNWIKTPAAYVDYYADSYSIDDSLSFYFIFLTENSVEISGTDNEVIYSRVVRLCKNDPGVGVLRGSSQEFRADFFKTFVKAYIYCEKPIPGGTNSVPGSTSYQYNVIRKVSLVRNSIYRVGVSRRDRVVYGLFTGPTYGPPGSAICVFSADMSNNNDRGIFNVFNEEFRNLQPSQPGETSCTTENVPNDDPFTCDPGTHNKSRPMPEFDVLMSPAVSQLTTDPLVELNGIMATSLYTTQTLVRNSSSNLTEVDVMLVGTDDGKILKIVMTYNGTNHVPLISEELSLADNLPIQNMEPQFDDDGKFNELLLSTDSYIYRIPPQRCDRFETCVDCVEARDPYCFWDSSQGGCTILQDPGMYDSRRWYQDIHRGNVTQFTNCSGTVSNFTVTSIVACNSGVAIIITPEDTDSSYYVESSIEQLPTCGTGGSINSPGLPLLVAGSPITLRYTMSQLETYTWYRVNVTAGNIMRTVTFRTCGGVPLIPSVSGIFPTVDGMLVYPNIGCLKDEITNYTITVVYQYTLCTGSTQSGSMTLPGANGTLFNITGLGSYTLITNINVTVENSFGSNLVISSESLRTIEQATNSMVTSLSAVSTSYSLNVSWSAPSSLCGTLTGYSVYLDSKQMTNCNGQRSHLITGLQPFTQYSVSVTVCTIAGEGPMATIPSGMTRTDPGSPTRVQPVTLATLTSNVFLSWDDVQFNDVGGTYEVDYTCYGRGDPVSKTVPNITTTNYTISGINCYEADCYGRVRAINMAGIFGQNSSEFRGFTSCPTALPSSESVTVNDISVETLTNNSIYVTWTVPSDYCGPKRTFVATVTLQGSNTPLCTTSTSQNFMNCNGLEFSRSYGIRVVTRITCSSGSVSSDPSVFSKNYTYPCFITDPPNNVNFIRSGSVTLRWGAVTNCGNVMYNVYWSCRGSEQMASTSQTSYALNVNNVNSFSYCVGQVQACNDQGCGAISDSASVLIPLKPPPAPFITGTVNGTTVLIMFSISEPTNLDDLRYSLYRRLSNTTVTSFELIFTNVSYNYTNVIIDNDPGEQRSYEYQMELHNCVGTGPPSNIETVTTTQDPPPNSPSGIIVTQIDDKLEVRWTALSSNSPLTYTVQYDTVPPSRAPSGSLFNEDRINISSATIPGDNLVFGQNCSVRVRAFDERTNLYGAWSYAGICYVMTTDTTVTMHPPDAPSVINDILTDVKLFELKWGPPTSINRFISNYTIELANETADIDDCSRLCNNQVLYMYRFTVEPNCTVYREMINVTENTCFCAIVTAVNEAGSERTVVSKFYEINNPTTVGTPVTEANRAIMNNNCDIPLVGIILAVVLIFVGMVAVILGVIFCCLFNSQRQAKGNGISRKNSY